MTDGPGLATSRPQSGRWFATAWPPILTGDSESLRRRKFAVRAGHLAMALMIVVAVGTTLFVEPEKLQAGRIYGLGLVSLLYVLWNLIGTHGIVTLVLWESGTPPSSEKRGPRFGGGRYFVVQMALAGLVYVIADQGHIPNLVWLVLLPPVAYAVFFLEWRGITGISLLTMSVLVLNAFRWHGWKFAAFAAVAFSFAVLFTLVFTLLAVHSEKARHEVQRLAGELTEANRQLRDYAVRVEELAATRERNRIAREIHDSLGHYLTVVNVQIEAARTMESVDPARARAALAKAQTLTQEGLQDIRRSLAALRSSPLDNKSLVEGLRELVASSCGAGTRAEFQLLGELRSLSSPAELSLYRAVQEGLTNVRKHARAEMARVILDFRVTKRVSVSVGDNGGGMAAGAESGGYGLLGLRERAQLLGGLLRVETAPRQGFTITLELPE